MTGLTQKRMAVLRFVAHFIAAKGYSPSLQEIADAVGSSSLATIFKHVGSLDYWGYLTHRKHEYRSIEVTARGRKALKAEPVVCPQCGHEFGKQEMANVQREPDRQLSGNSFESGKGESDGDQPTSTGN